MTDQPNEFNQANDQGQSNQPQGSASTPTKKKTQVDPSKTIKALYGERADGQKSKLKVDPNKTIPYLQTGADHERKRKKTD